MNKHKLEIRLAEIDQSMRQVIAQYNSLEGCRDECLRWLRIIEKEEKENGDE